MFNPTVNQELNFLTKLKNKTNSKSEDTKKFMDNLTTELETTKIETALTSLGL